MFSDNTDTYVCLLLHVLIGDDDEIVVEDETASESSSWVEESSHDLSFWSKLKTYFKRSENEAEAMVQDAENAAGVDESQRFNVVPIAQHYHPDRKTIYDEVKSTREASLTVAVEQVSIFLTSDGTVITFFQVSLHNL